MTLVRISRLPLLAAALVLTVAVATAQDDKKKTDPGKMPPLDAKEWKKQDNGMKVWNVKEGTGPEVQKGDTVTIHYTGWTTDGMIFDSSRKELSSRPTDGKPATFPLGGLIKGWQEGVPGMKPGGVRRLYIPYPLAYGEQGRPPVIPQKADLVFEIEVVDARRK
ncbi:MAG TPA: FKBP-type peptidyl-prolyl cis-trans isomerase [Fimbriiglobus sp.]|jgi:FKBP-type peptidyl-prolyl cis-trans isomerase|nr:FKBP-type peptidyl-prolyl cis-trans isomerase [Fimbriiglobus sp.]